MQLAYFKCTGATLHECYTLTEKLTHLGLYCFISLKHAFHVILERHETFYQLRYECLDTKVHGIGNLGISRGIFLKIIVNYVVRLLNFFVRRVAYYRSLSELRFENVD